MKRFSVVLALLVAFSGARAEGPDDQYVRVYNLIQEADKLSSGGQPGEALPKYLQAQTALQRLQKGFPDWNAKVVSFRLNYVAERIAAASPRGPAPVAPAPSGAATKPAPPPAIGPAPPAPPGDWENQLNTLKDQARQLQADKAVLEAKLKEALSVQPEAMDPRELARAEAKIRDLLKENDLLKVSLTQERAKAVPALDTKAPDETRQALAEANRKLDEQTKTAKALALERTALQDKLNKLTASSSAAAELETTRKALEDANRKLDEQTKTAGALAVERTALQAKLNDLARSPASPPELEAAKKALEEANRKLAEQTKTADALASEKTALQDKLSKLTPVAADASELETTRKALEDANRKLDEQAKLASQLASEKEALQTRLKAQNTDVEAAAALRAENQLLKKQLADLKTAPPPASTAEQASRQLAEAQAQIAALQSDKELLRLARIALEQRVKQLSSQSPAPAPPPATAQAADAAKIKQLEQERDDLKKQLAAANKELSGRRTKAAADRVADLENQLATLRSRLQVLEARQVPYTAEELALLKPPETKLTQPPRPSGKTSVKELPAGTVALVAEAQRAYANRQYDQARQKYLQVLQQDNKNVPTLANLAAIELDLGHLQAAEINIKQAVALAPDDPYSHFVLGRLKFRQKKYDDAIDALSRAAKLDPQDAQIQNFLGLALGEKGLRGPAETALRKAIQLDPAYASAHNNLAVVYLAQQPPLLELARWHYQKALAAGHPRNPDLEKMLDAAKPAAATR